MNLERDQIILGNVKGSAVVLFVSTYVASTATAQIVPPLPECLIVETGDRINSFSLGYGAGVANYMCFKPWRAILLNLWAMRFWVNTNYGLKIRARINLVFSPKAINQKWRASIRHSQIKTTIFVLTADGLLWIRLLKADSDSFWTLHAPASWNTITSNRHGGNHFDWIRID